MENTMNAALEHAQQLAKYLGHCSSTYIIQIALKELSVPSSRDGFHLAKNCVRLLLENPVRTLTHGVYVAAALVCGFPTDDKLVEQAIRTAVQAAWKDRDEAVWNCYFPVGKLGRCKCPSNKEFMMAIVDFVKLWEGFCEEGKYEQKG